MSPQSQPGTSSAERRSDSLLSLVTFGQGQCFQPALVSGQIEPKSREEERREIFLPARPVSFAARGDLRRGRDSRATAGPGEGLQDEARWCTTSLTTSFVGHKDGDLLGEQGCGHRILPFFSPIYSQKEEGIICIPCSSSPGFASAEQSRGSELGSVWPCSCEQVGSPAPSKGPQISALGSLAPALSCRELTQRQQRSRGL